MVARHRRCRSKRNHRWMTPRRAVATRTSGVSGVDVEADVATPARELGAMIDAVRKHVAVTANAALVTVYWQIGHRVRTEVLEGQRAEYGAQIVATVSRIGDEVRARLQREVCPTHGAVRDDVPRLDLHERSSHAPRGDVRGRQARRRRRQ